VSPGNLCTRWIDSKRSDQGAGQSQWSVVVDHPWRRAAIGDREDGRSNVDDKVPISEAVIRIDRKVSF
jgi:hypothetical protein